MGINVTALQLHSHIQSWERQPRQLLYRGVQVPQPSTAAEKQTWQKNTSTLRPQMLFPKHCQWMKLSQPQSDSTLQATIAAARSGQCYKAGPKVHEPTFKTLSNLKHELAVIPDNGIIFRVTRIVIPSSLQNHTIKIAHEGHQWIVKTKGLLLEKVWFPGIDQLVNDKVKGCISHVKPSTHSICADPLQMT